MVYNNIGDYQVYCISCMRKNSWENFFNTQVNHDYLGKCEYCGGRCFPVDKNMIKPLLMLWKKGYKTGMSCGGHTMKDAVVNQYPYLGIVQETDGCPEGWDKEFSDETQIWFLRTPFGVPIDNQLINKLNQNLIQWVKSQKPATHKASHETVEIQKRSQKNNQVNLFLGSHVNKARVQFRKHYVLKKGHLTLELLNKHNKVILKHPNQLQGIDFETTTLKEDQSIVVMFPLNPEHSRYKIPVSALGWGSFARPKPNHDIFISLFKYNPRLWTHDKFLVYEMHYEKKKRQK